MKRKPTPKYEITKAYVEYMGPDGKCIHDKPRPDSWPGVMCVNWVANGFGFGQLAFYERKGRLHCNTECMDKEFVKAVMDKLLDGAKYID